MVSTFSDAASVVQNTIIKSYPQVKKAYIFGSFADGAHNSESDLDVLVELDNAMGLQFISMIQDLEKATGTSVDIITVEQAKNLEEKFGYEILRKARSIYERSSMMK